jgi:hypothetical protein
MLLNLILLLFQKLLVNRKLLELLIESIISYHKINIF